MRLRFFIIGTLGLILLTFALTSFFYAKTTNSGKKNRKPFTIFMTLLALIGLSGFGYMSYHYVQVKYLARYEKKAHKVMDNTTGKMVTTVANAKERLVLPTAYNTVETTHPSVVAFPEKWHGYKYWMAVTSYPKGDAAKENPHIFGSNDLVTWEAANDLKNPLDEPKSKEFDQDDNPKQYDSDTHIVYNQEKDRLEVFWRYVDDIKDEAIIYRADTLDGKKWSDKKITNRGPRKTDDWVSPAFVKDETGYKVWYVANGYRIWYRESQDGHTWTKPVEVKVPYENKQANMHHWHLDVQKIDGKYEMILVGSKQEGEKPDLEERHVMNLYHSTSADGKNWSDLKAIIYPSQKKEAWDGRGIYRSCFIKENGKYYVFYSGIGFDDTRGIGLAYGSNINKLKGIDMSNYANLHKISKKNHTNKHND